MASLLSGIVDGAKALYGLAFPMFAGPSAAGAEDAHPARRWAARLVLLAPVMTLLWMVNRWETLGLRNWVTHGRLGEFWLPLLALCLYAALWLSWWLYRILSLDLEPMRSDFPDIDAAWDRVKKALADADVSLDATPLFLALGASPEADGPFFRATGLRMKVRPSESDAGEPVRAAASRDGIWVLAAGVGSLADLGHHAPSRDPADLSLQSLAEGSTEAGLGRPADDYATVGIPQLSGRALEKILKNAEASNRSAADPERARARLRHLCRLIGRDRGGFCPANGILVMLPVTAADPKQDVRDVAMACRSDLTVAHDAFAIRCPTLFLIGELDALDGFSDLIARLPNDQLGNRRGQRYPLVPELPPEEIAPSVRGSVEWLAETYLPSVVHNAFLVENPGAEEASEVLDVNARLFRFLLGVQERRARLGELVEGCLPDLDGEPLMFAGCYFAGAAGEASERQAFAAGVLQRMIEDQDRVTWTADTLARDAAHHRAARLARGLLGTVVAAGVVLAVILGGFLVFGGPADGPGPDAVEG